MLIMLSHLNRRKAKVMPKSFHAGLSSSEHVHPAIDANITLMD